MKTYLRWSTRFAIVVLIVCGAIPPHIALITFVGWKIYQNRQANKQQKWVHCCTCIPSGPTVSSREEGMKSHGERTTM